MLKGGELQNTKSANIIEEETSGKRDSNSRPSAWEADALPTELLPQNI